MSQVARVFVVLNLLISAGFLFAAATFLALNSDWKTKFEAEVDGRRLDNEEKDRQIGTLNDEKTSLEGQVRALEEQRGALTGARDALTQQVSSLQSQIAQKDTEIAALTNANQEHATSVQNLRNDLNSMNQRNEQLAADNRSKTKEASDAVAAKETADAKIVELENTIHENEKTITRQGDDISERDLLIAYAKSKGIDFENAEVMPPLSGFVVNANNDMRLVQVNVGASQGMKRGYLMDVVRGDQYIGRVRIDTVFPNQSAGLLTIVADGQAVMVGDRVTNTLN